MFGVQARVAAQKDFLTEVQKQGRLTFSTEYGQEGDDYWARVGFCDEKTFGFVIFIYIITFCQLKQRLHMRFIKGLTNADVFLCTGRTEHDFSPDIRKQPNTVVERLLEFGRGLLRRVRVQFIES